MAVRPMEFEGGPGPEQGPKYSPAAVAVHGYGKMSRCLQVLGVVPGFEAVKSKKAAAGSGLEPRHSWVVQGGSVVALVPRCS